MLVLAAQPVRLSAVPPRAAEQLAPETVVVVVVAPAVVVVAAVVVVVAPVVVVVEFELYIKNSSIDHQLGDTPVVSTTWRYWSVTGVKLTMVGWPLPVQLATVVQLVPLVDTSTL